jgi:Holliday junction resolvase-like predicted endonuclease
LPRGFRILARRWRSPVGEIEIVARRRQLLVFVEVEARASLEEAAESVNERQRRRIRRRRRFGWRQIRMKRSEIADSMQFW